MKRHLAWALLALALMVPPVAAARQSTDEEVELTAAVQTDPPAESVKAIRTFIAKHPQSALMPMAQFVLTRALLASDAPSKELVDAAKQTFGTRVGDPTIIQARAELLYGVTSKLVERKEQLDDARALIKSLSDAMPADRRADAMRRILKLIDASVLTAQNKRDEAIATIQKVVAEDPDNQAAVLQLAQELELAGRVDEAVDAYIRAESVFEGERIDGTALRTLYQKKHGSLDGLDAKLAEARSASLRRVAIDGNRVEIPAPDWELKDLSGAPVKLSGLKGQVVVLDFWATWCPPCREELPHIEQLHGEYAGKNVRILAVNCEGAPDLQSWDKLVRGYVERNKFTFTVVNDLDLTVNEAYDVSALPTVFVIDKTGTIRFINRGFAPSVKEILRAQIDSLTN